MGNEADVGYLDYDERRADDYDVESVDDLWLLNDADFREVGVSVGLRRKLLNALATVPLH